MAPVFDSCSDMFLRVAEPELNENGMLGGLGPLTWAENHRYMDSGDIAVCT